MNSIRWAAAGILVSSVTAVSVVFGNTAKVITTATAATAAALAGYVLIKDGKKHETLLYKTAALISGLDDFKLEVREQLQLLVADANKTKLNAAFEHLYLNQKGLVSLEELCVSSGLPVAIAAPYMQEKINELGAAQIQNVPNCPATFLFNGHPEPVIEVLKNAVQQELIASKEAEERAAYEAWREAQMRVGQVQQPIAQQSVNDVLQTLQ